MAKALRAALVCFVANLIITTAQSRSQTESAPKLAIGSAGQPLDVKTERPGVWQSGIGEGFRSRAEAFKVGLGANYSVAILGRMHCYDLALVSVSYGHKLGPIIGESRWFHGNFELRGQLFSGEEFSADQEWLVGFSPNLRHDIATGTHRVPFADIGAGVTTTGIGPPDPSGTLEFNMQAGFGVHRFIGRDPAVTVERQFLRLSCAGPCHPNLGLNGITGTLGATILF